VLIVSTMIYPETAELLDSDKVLVISAPPSTPDRLFGAFPRSAQVDRLVGELAGELNPPSDYRACAKGLSGGGGLARRSLNCAGRAST
jgi:hypothetical protein